MRIVLDTLVALMVAGILAGVTLHQRNRDSEEVQVEELARNVKILNREVQLRAALSQSSVADRGFPEAIDPEWFQDALPRNPLLDDGRPWVEVATIDERSAGHPPDIGPEDKLSAGFWYNPAKGIVRARVPIGLSDRGMLELYNHVNDSNLGSRFPVSTTASD